MASLITVRLDKGGSPNLGFRLQGGKDFGTPLVIQKVNGGSPAERAGLVAGDSVIKINNTDVFNLRHKDAQDVILRAGPSFEVTVQRGGSVWKPAVTPVGSIHSTSSVSPVTKTSLAAPKKENIGAIGTGHNVSAKPFSAQLNGAVNGGPRIVNNQYNSPLKLYSEESIAETLSAQTEVLSTGALGVNFKKNEKNYDATNSAVYRMLQETENEPKTPEAVSPRPDFYASHSHAIGGRQVTSPRSNTPLDDHSRLSSRLGDYPYTHYPDQEGVTKCTECERVIVGVFVRIKDKNLHVECFKCSTCGTSLKNVGYYNINNKLYCDVHAKLAARANPPAPNLVPVTVPPGGKAPANAISSALASHSLPSPAPLSPRPNLAQPFQAGNYSSTPKPFSSVSAPVPSQSYNTLPKAAPISPIQSAPAPSYSPASSTGRAPVKPGRSVQNIVWPPPPEEPEVPTACPLYVPPLTHLKVVPKTIKKEEISDCQENFESRDCLEIEEFNNMAHYQVPKLSLCSEEVSSITSQKSTTECIETISETLETQKLVENVLKKRPPSPPPIDQDIVVSERKQTSEAVCRQESAFKSSAVCTQSKETCELKRLSEFKPNTVECTLKSQVENAVPRKWESQMVQALRTVPDTASKETDPFTQIPKKYSASPLASALSIAPSEPFTPQTTHLEPVPLPEETEPYFPPEHPITIEPKEPKPEKPPSEFVKALQTVPEKPFAPAVAAPIKKKKNPTDELLKDLPKPQQKLTLREALMTAPDRSYSPFTVASVQVDAQKTKEVKIEKHDLQRPLKPATLPPSFKQPLLESKPQAPKPFPVMMHNPSTAQEITEHDVVKSRTKENKQEKHEEKESDVKKSTTIEKHQTQSTIEQSVEEINDDVPQGMYPLFKGFSCSFGNKSEHSEFTIEISTTPPLINMDRTHTPTVKISRTGESSESVKETVTERSHVQEKSSQETKEKTVEKQAEQVILKKPLPLVSTLHKPEGLPQYQVNISESAEADLLLMQKIEAAKTRLDQQKVASTAPPKPPREFQTKPVITIQPGDTNAQSGQIFKPVSEDRPPSSTFSPRPRSITPSMINKPPPTLPYYQSSLVAQQYRAPVINLLDPTSPAVSRSPSPCPDKRRSPSPFPSVASAVRPKSPAAGPPPNPLKSSQPLPTPRDSKIEEAKRNLTTYIPQHKSKMELVQKAQTQIPQIYVAHAETQNITGQEMVQSEVSSAQSLQVASEKVCMMERKEVEDAMRSQVMSKQTEQGTVSTAVSEQSHMAHLEQLSKSESKSVEQSSDGMVQVQRKKTVTEEFEHTQKSQMVQIEKNVSSSKTHPFRDVKNPELESTAGFHLTNPQPIMSPFLKADSAQASKPQSQQFPIQSQQQLPIQRQQQLPPPPQQQFLPAPQHQIQPPQQPQAAAAAPPIKHVPAPSLTSPIKHVAAPSGSARQPNQNVNRSNVPVPNAGSGAGGGRQAGAIGVAPKRGRGILNTAGLGGTRIPLCASCHNQIRGPFITALGKIWCPEHFICATPSCRRPLQDLGFVEEQGQLYCEYCFEQYLAPTCSKCNSKIKGDCLKAIGKNFHPECFSCVYCGKLFGNSPFFLEDGSPYCEADWNELFTTKCFACGFPVEAGDRWVEALNNNYHSQCFNCTMCKKNLEGQSFFAKGGRPFCKNHAR